MTNKACHVMSCRSCYVQYVENNTIIVNCKYHHYYMVYCILHRYVGIIVKANKAGQVMSCE